MAVPADIDHLSSAITHTMAPAFMLGAVAGFLSILIARMERIMDRKRAHQSGDLVAVDPSIREKLANSFACRVAFLGAAILYAVLSALVAALLLSAAFLAALAGIGHGGIVAVMFVIVLAFLIAALVQFAREIRQQMATAHLD